MLVQAKSSKIGIKVTSRWKEINFHCFFGVISTETRDPPTQEPVASYPLLVKIQSTPSFQLLQHTFNVILPSRSSNWPISKCDYHLRGFLTDSAKRKSPHMVKGNERWNHSCCGEHLWRNTGWNDGKFQSTSAYHTECEGINILNVFTWIKTPTSHVLHTKFIKGSEIQGGP